ncbi:MAG: hypothetical protein ACP5E3_11830 [Bacteroidales bacterium]
MNGVDKDVVVKAVISKITEESTPTLIKVKDLNEFETPAVIKTSEQEGDGKFIPDIVVNYEKSTNLYEIELEDGSQIEKWKVFADYAKENNGHLYIVTPDYLKDRIKKEITDNDFNAGLIYFST